MGKRVLIECRDLFFRGKLQEVVRSAGAEPVREEPFDLAVIELARTDAAQRITDLVAGSIPVLAFGSHVDAAALRAARDLGARAVPNSEVENSLRALLRS
jgi:hypothetical protein